jgi:hypothetical protein
MSKAPETPGRNYQYLFLKRPRGAAVLLSHTCTPRGMTSPSHAGANPQWVHHRSQEHYGGIHQKPFGLQLVKFVAFTNHRPLT